MQPFETDTVMDVGAGELVRVLVGFGIAVVLTLVMAVLLPLVLVAHLVLTPLGGAMQLLAVPMFSTGPAVVVAPAELATAPSHAVDVARRYLGVPYVFGGTNPQIGLDCSGLVQLVFRQIGIALPRTAQQQFDATLRIGRDQLQPGDLVFFARTYSDPRDWITHVGIYVGDGQHINAPTPGQVVSIQPAFSGFWGAHYAGAGRVQSGLSETRP